MPGVSVTVGAAMVPKCLGSVRQPFAAMPARASACLGNSQSYIMVSSGERSIKCLSMHFLFDDIQVGVFTTLDCEGKAVYLGVVSPRG